MTKPKTIKLNLELLTKIKKEWNRIFGTNITPSYTVFSDGSAQIQWDDFHGFHKGASHMQPFNDFIQKQGLPLWTLIERQTICSGGFSLCYIYEINVPKAKKNE